MTVDEYFVWAGGRSGRFELCRGKVSPLSPQTAGYVEIKGAVYRTLLASVRARGSLCHVLPNGPAVRINETTAFEPDALVYSGSKLPSSAIEVPDPVIVVDVLLPRRLDSSLKLAGYFRLPSIVHYLIVDPTEPMIVHHARAQGGDILTRVVTEGSIVLDPPGLELALADIYGG